jgi:hypothetical protein
LASIISLHKRQVFFEGSSVEFARLYVYESETTTQVAVYSDSALTSARSQPIEADAAGVFPVCYVAASASLRFLVTDQNDVALPGYPMDDITPEPVGNSAADEISFTPISGVAETNVQDAIESVYATAAAVTDTVAARFTPFTTAGSSDAYTLTPSPAATAYAAGQSWTVRIDRANTGAATLNVSALGARNLMKYGPGGTLLALAAGELQIGQHLIVYDDGTQLVALLGERPIRTSNANGTSIRYPDGWQECRCVVYAAFETTTRLKGTWTFPQAFSSTTDLNVQATIYGGTTFGSELITAVGLREFGPLSPAAPSTTAVNLYLWLADSSSASLVEGDSVGLYVSASGRWF